MQGKLLGASFKQVLNWLFVSLEGRGCGQCGVHSSAGEITSIRMKRHASYHRHNCTFSLLCRKKTLKAFLLRNVFPSYSPDTRCWAFVMTQNKMSGSSAHLALVTSVLFFRVWRSQPAREWPVGWKNCLEQRTRDKNPRWALASAIKSLSFLGSQCP